MSDRYHFADKRLDRRFQRESAERKVQHFTGNGLAGAARELGKFSRSAALMTTEGRRFRRSLIGDDVQLFGKARLFQRRAAEYHTEMPPIGPHHIAFEPAELVKIK